MNVSQLTFFDEITIVWCPTMWADMKKKNMYLEFEYFMECSMQFEDLHVMSAS